MLEAPLAPVIPIRTRTGRRVLHTLHPAMAARYSAVVAAVAPAVERQLSASVLANRVAYASVDPPFIALGAWRAERRRFADRLAMLASDARHVVFTDVRRCYQSITPDAVARALESFDVGSGPIERVERTVSGFARIRIPGLPVGPNASAVLANAVLAVVDRALDDAAVPWIRWVDDIVVAVDDRARADEILDLVDEALDAVGLARNERKTRVLAHEDLRASDLSVSTRR
jgi:hypothetical protein